MSQTYFTYRESSERHMMIIVPKDYDNFPYKTTTGSYGVAPARVMGLKYHEYLRMLMYNFPEDVKVYGKNSRYPTVYWKRGETLYKFVRMLNKKMDLLVKEEKRLRDEENERERE